jgi:hypothetical protein
MRWVCETIFPFRAVSLEAHNAQRGACEPQGRDNGPRSCVKNSQWPPPLSPLPIERLDSVSPYPPYFRAPGVVLASSAPRKERESPAGGFGWLNLEKGCRGKKALWGSCGRSYHHRDCCFWPRRFADFCGFCRLSCYLTTSYFQLLLTVWFGDRRSTSRYFRLR